MCGCRQFVDDDLIGLGVYKHHIRECPAHIDSNQSHDAPSNQQPVGLL
jgi:hypothetical protein